MTASAGVANANRIVNCRPELDRSCFKQAFHAGHRPVYIAANFGFSRRLKGGRMRISMSSTAAEALVMKKATTTEDSTNKAVVYEKMDEWMRDSVVEIVKNLREAPLLVHVYNKNTEGEETRTLKTEKAVGEEKWPTVVEKWRRREVALPEGVIFVEQLAEEGVKEVEEGVTRAWGIVVQGKGAECGPICYLLKTSRTGGGGLCCTHFCLMRVKSFRESISSQLTNCWLQTQNQ